MKRTISIAVLLLLAGLPLAAPLFACMKSCCGCAQAHSDLMFRPEMTCCKISSLPGNTTPAKLAVSPPLAAPAPSGFAVQPLIVAAPVSTSEAAITSHTVFLNVPIRI